MKNMKYFKIYLGVMVLVFFGCQSVIDFCEIIELWYVQLVEVWMEFLFIGNGCLGVMIYGGIEEEKLVLNELIMWFGQYNENQNIFFG